MWSTLTSLVSPKKFFHFSSKLLPWLSVAFVCLFSYGLIGGLILAPSDYMQGDGYRIIYVHVPCAFLSLAVYGVMTVAAFTSIVWRLKLASSVIRHSAPMGALFTALALITGSIWGKPMWGTWWIWDARLTSELILLFLYLGILLYSRAIAQKQQADRAIALLVIVGFIDIPIIHYSVNWWNTLHQGSTLKLFSPSAIDPAMLYPLLAMIAAFSLYYAIVLMMKMRYDLIVLDAKPYWLKEKA